MKADNPIQTKSYAFALRIVKLYRYFCDEKKEFVLSKQIVRSGTSIGANVEEAIGGQSNKDVLSKMNNRAEFIDHGKKWLRSVAKLTGRIRERRVSEILSRAVREFPSAETS